MVDLTYSASVQPDALPGRPAPRFPDEASPQDYGSEIGRGLENAGNVVEGVYKQQKAAADEAARVAQQQAKQTQLADAHNKLQSLSLQLTHDPQTGALAQQGQNAFDLGNKYLPQFDDAAAQIVGGVADPEAKQAAMMAARQVRTQMSEQLDSHELQQHNEFADKTDLASVHIAQQAGPANYNNAGILATNHDTIAASLENMAQRKGWSPDELDQAKQEAFSKFHTDVIDRMATDNKFGMAQHYLDANKKDMDANTAFSAERMIQEHIKQAQNEAKFGIQSKLTDSLQGAEFGLKNPVTVSRQELNLLYDKEPGRAQRVWDGLQSMVETGAQVRNYNQLSPEQLQQDVQSHQPTEGGTEAGLQIKSYQMRAQAAQRSLDQRAQDPAQFAEDNKLWPALDLKNLNNTITGLAQRAGSLEQVQAQVGQPVSLLSKPQAKAVSAYMDSLPPANRMQVLTQIRSTMPDDQSYTNLMRTIAPNSPITALAGARVDKPAAGAQPAWWNPAFADRSGPGMRSQADIAQSALEGDAILHAKGEKGVSGIKDVPPDKSTSSEPGLDQAFNNLVTPDLMRGRAQLTSVMYDMYKANYVALANKQGKLSGKLDPDLAQQAAAEVIGHVTTYGSSSVVVPSGMDPTRFQGVVDNASHAALAEAGYNDKDIKALRGANLRELGDQLGTGRYNLVDGSGAPLLAKDRSRPIVIDLNRAAGGPATAVAAPTRPMMAPLSRHEFNRGGAPGVTSDAADGT
jgi:hypothetical protein